MKLSHPVDDAGYAEFRETIERMFIDSDEGISVAELEEFGVFELLDESPVVAARALFEGQGAVVGSGATVDGFVLNALRGAGADLPSGEDIGLLLQVPGRSDSYVALLHGERAPSHFVLSATDRPGDVLLVESTAVQLTPVRTIDPDVRLFTAPADVQAQGQVVLSDHAGIIGNHAATAIAMQLVGVAEHLLETGRDYSTIREQFGRPIAAFQAVQHLLADAAVAVAAAQGTAAVSIEELADRDRAELAVLLATGAAARAFVVASRSIQQVLGAVGYTVEHEFARYFYRGHVLSYLVGASSIDQRIGQFLRDHGTMEIMPVSSWQTDAEEA